MKRDGKTDAKAKKAPGKKSTSGSENEQSAEVIDWSDIPYYEGGALSCYAEEDEISSIALMPAFL